MGNVEYKLRKAVKHATPDMKDQILAKCKTVKNDGTVPIIINNGTRNRRAEHVYALIATAAMILLTFNLSFDAYNSSLASRVMTVVDIDVNPSIELNINGNDRIVSVRAINEDAIEILDGMDLTGAQTKVAINAIMGSMFEHGYLQGDTDSVLVSVSNKDAEKAMAVQRNVTENIDSLMKAYSQDVSVIGQTIEKEDTELVNKSNDYGISEGKVALINKIIALTSLYTFDELAQLNITELNEIICSLQDMDDPLNPENRHEDDGLDPIISDPATGTGNLNNDTGNNGDKKGDTLSDGKDNGIDGELTDPSADKNLDNKDNPDKNSVSDNSVSQNEVILENN